MRDLPILFSTPMICALEREVDPKTQTRRALRTQPDAHHWERLRGYELKRSKIVTINERCAVKFSHSIPLNREWETALDWLLCPYGQPGDQLWVKETFYAYGRWVTQFNAKKGRDEWHFIDMTVECGHSYCYAATDPDPTPARTWPRRSRGGVTPGWWKRPAIFMPRAASRILLENTDVRVQRLQDISEEDAKAEGVECDSDGWRDYQMPHTQCCVSARDSYRTLWDSINGPGGWHANPFIWAISFRRISPAIDEALRAEGGKTNA